MLQENLAREEPITKIWLPNCFLSEPIKMAEASRWAKRKRWIFWVPGRRGGDLERLGNLDYTVELIGAADMEVSQGTDNL